MFTTYTAAGNNPDQPGRFIQWLYKQTPVKTHQIRGTWFDIGSKETLEEANRLFAKVYAAATRRAIFQPALVEFDQVEISADVFPSVATGFLQKVKEPRFLDRRIRRSRNHRFIPLLDFFRRMFRALFAYPFQNSRVVFASVRRFLKRFRIEFQKREQMFIESGRLVIVAVKQTFAMQARFVDQSRQMHVTAESFVGTAWKKLCALTATTKSRATAGRQ